MSDFYFTDSIGFLGRNVMMDGCSILGLGRVDELVVLLLLIGMIWREKNLMSRCCLSCLIFRREERVHCFAIVIHFANEFVFNLENIYDVFCKLFKLFGWNVFGMLLKGANLLYNVLVQLILFITILWSNLLDYVTVIFPLW